MPIAYFTFGFLDSEAEKVRPTTSTYQTKRMHVKGIVQRKLRWVEIGINRQL
jgi:hypothetical protein